MKQVFIGTEYTPNPNSLKFISTKNFIEKGSFYFSSPSSAIPSPLAQRLFSLPDVKGVLIAVDFVTITRTENSRSWEDLTGPITSILEEHLTSGEPAVMGTQQAPETSSEIEKRILAILDEQIRPLVARDGGDIVFHSFLDGVVKLTLQGACASCPSSTATLKAGVERMLKEYIPEIKEVLSV